MPGLIIKSKIREAVKKLDSENQISSVAEEVESELEKKVEEIKKQQYFPVYTSKRIW